MTVEIIMNHDYAGENDNGRDFYRKQSNKVFKILDEMNCI
jgi:hypothetical protein